MENKISIIIPAYNIEQYLGNTLDSVLAQTYPNLEIIVVNDGSTDGTGNVINHYAALDNRIRTIHKENGGVTSARLCGLEAASGEWIGFVDGDDHIEPQMYEKLLSNALKYDADISHCGYQMVFPNGRIDCYYNTEKIILQDTLQGCSDLLTGTFVEPALWNKLYHRKLFIGLADILDINIKINEDVLMNYFLFKQSRLSIFEDVCPYHYVLRKGSAATSKININKLRDPLRVTHIIYNDAEESLRSILLERLCRQLISGATMSLSTQPDLIRPFRSDCRKELRSLLMDVLKCNCGLKLKIMALWVATWPASYSFVHTAYARITGLDKKYDLD